MIISSVDNGYSLPFVNLKEPVKLQNNKSAWVHVDFVDQALSLLVSSGRVHMVNKQPLVVNPLSVFVQQNGKKRLILDLRNKRLLEQRVKYKDWLFSLTSRRICTCFHLT